jgi:uncharacterized DUF497 family protein
MVEFSWSAEKEERLKAARGVSFEEVQTAIEEGGLIDVVPNPDPEQPRGLMYIVLMRGYTWVVPFHRDGHTIVLHTAFPDRRMMNRYGFR